MIKAWNSREIVDLWESGLSPAEIIDRLHLTISPRQVQRIGSARGDRKRREVSRLTTGRIAADDMARSGPLGDIVRQLTKARGDDPHTCAICGVHSDKELTIHHTKYQGATIEDLVFACWNCQMHPVNKGLL